MVIRGVVLLAVVLLGSGCVFQSQAVKIHPEVKSSATVDGAGKGVRLSVQDERPSKVIGQRGVGDVGADMTVDGDLTSIVTNAVLSGLGQRHFSASGAGGAQLRLEIRNLSSKNVVGFWSETLRDEFSLKGICKSDRGADYEQMYYGLYETSLQVVPTAAANEKYISQAVADSINKLVSDDQMLRCLAEP